MCSVEYCFLEQLTPWFCQCYTFDKFPASATYTDAIFSINLFDRVNRVAYIFVVYNKRLHQLTLDACSQPVGRSTDCVTHYYCNSKEYKLIKSSH